MIQSSDTKNSEVYECTMATLQFKNGILYFISKPVERNLENAKELVSLLEKILNGNKAYVFVDATLSKAMTKEARDYLDGQLPSYYQTVAVTSKSFLGSFVANLFVKLKPPSYRIKIFSNEASAKRWLNYQMKAVA